MDYRPAVVIATVILSVIDLAHLVVGIAVTAETSEDRDNYLKVWVLNLISTIIAGKSIFVGAHTNYKNIVEGFDLNKKRHYDLFNVIVGICLFIASSAIGETHKNPLAHMYFGFTVGFYVVKTIFSSILLCSRFLQVSI
ncbi:MAG: hypothetical protein Harvfovirus1_8 [Harvfovirus sp.]|uniref:Uncharacterized protein n=1 Tax=Harvfovirus sp. TaxID=2487768 RepID=A0A3G5A3H4_9VIRU|nr:MAG: hypothetical protein Harvfovirus1_8 [Harvfovirus sp.]